MSDYLSYTEIDEDDIEYLLDNINDLENSELNF